MQKVGITAFYQIVSLISEDTQRHPPTRQFFTSCVEILGQVKSFIKGHFLFTCKKFFPLLRFCGICRWTYSFGDTWQSWLTGGEFYMWFWDYSHVVYSHVGHAFAIYQIFLHLFSHVIHAFSFFQSWSCYSGHVYWCAISMMKCPYIFYLRNHIFFTQAHVCDFF